MLEIRHTICTILEVLISVKGRPKKLSLSPIQREIMWTLEEDYETLPTVFNTVHVHFPEHLEISFADQISEAILGLYTMGLVEFSRQVTVKHGPAVRVVEQDESVAVESLKCVHYDAQVQSWGWDQGLYGDEHFALAVSLTDPGFRALRT
ncbi:MAG TPA: hypothetical protein VF952_10195 [Chloroflexia bacterium]